jgi:hypothetical protein
MCLYPKLIHNKKYTATKKNGGLIPSVSDKRVLLVPVGCGKCIECMKQKSRNWQVRLNEEIRTNNRGVFVTLTFNDATLIGLGERFQTNSEYARDNMIATLAVRRFLERWRKKHKVSVRHWLVTELGQTSSERIHLHGIIFTEKPEEIEKTWGYGFVGLGTYVNEKTINYIVKYINKTDEKHKNYIPIILCSKGIGGNYIKRPDSQHNRFNGAETKEFYRTKTGTKLSLPTYYRNKIYNENEREELWLNKLDKEERYVCGERVDISQNEDDYYNVLKHYQQKNKRLGYGDDHKSWDEWSYKSERKRLKKYEQEAKLSKPVVKKTKINLNIPEEIHYFAENDMFNKLNKEWDLS